MFVEEKKKDNYLKKRKHVNNAFYKFVINNFLQGFYQQVF